MNLLIKLSFGVKILLVLLLIHEDVYLQTNDNLYAMEAFKFIPPDKLGATLDYSDARIVRWSDYYVYNNITLWTVFVDWDSDYPVELWGDESDILALQQEVVGMWNSNFCLKLIVDDDDDFGIDVFFLGDEDFWAGAPADAVGYTYIPISEYLDDNYNPYYVFEQYSSDSKVTNIAGEKVERGMIILRVLPSEDGYTWSASSNFVNNNTYLVKNVLAHEIGHSLGLGHTSPQEIYQPPNLMSYAYNLSSPVELSDWDKGGIDYHCLELYNKVVGVGDPQNWIDITAYPLIIDENQQFPLYAQFNKGNPNSAAHVLSWNWILKLYHENGTYEYVNETFSGSSYYSSCSWTLNTVTLPTNFSWILNSNGHIETDLILSAEIAGDGVSPVTRIISCNIEPSQPQNLQVRILHHIKFGKMPKVVA